ncbi:MAG TPA: hypothetical protein VF820_04710 [Patescibacteria group bacterium]
MKKLVVFCISLLLLTLSIQPVFAIENPTATTNNKVGVHILFTSELQQAAKIINTTGGDWGYVIIPIQSGDKDMKKWEAFMDQAKQLHIIPIIRLATEGDYFNTKVWRKPTPADVLDFANFLNSLNWPVKNRYIEIYNEVNRDNEWGGQASASEYAQLLSYAVTVFKSASPDFFIISAGMDNASINGNGAINEYTYFNQMNQAIPGIFSQIDGIGSHSYPNPGFNQPPTTQTAESITSFKYESSLIDSLANRQLPIFITETGWSRNGLSDQTIAGYFTTAFTSVWNDPRVVAVTPFILEAGGGPFEQFSLLNPNGADTPISLAIKNLSKQKGQPTINPSVLAAETTTNNTAMPVKWFGKSNKANYSAFVLHITKVLGKYFLHLNY